MASSILAAPEGPAGGTLFTPAATCGWIKTRNARNSRENKAGQPAEGWPNSRLYSPDLEEVLGHTPGVKTIAPALSDSYDARMPGNAREKSTRRTIVWSVAACAFVALVAAGWFARLHALEAWHLERFASGNDDERTESLAALVEIKSTRLVDAVLHTLVATEMPPDVFQLACGHGISASVGQEIETALRYREAIREFGRLAEPALLRALVSNEELRSSWAAKLLGGDLRLPADGFSADRMFESLGSASPAARLGGIRLASELLLPLAPPQFFVTLEGDADDAEAFWEVRSSATCALKGRLSDEESHIRLAAFAALVNTDTIANEHFETALRSSDQKLRESAAAELALTLPSGDEWIGRDLVKRIATCGTSDHSREECRRIVGWLRAVEDSTNQWGNPTAVETCLVHALLDGSAVVEEVATVALLRSQRARWLPSDHELGRRFDRAYVRGLANLATGSAPDDAGRSKRKAHLALLELGSRAISELEVLAAEEKDRESLRALIESLRASQSTRKNGAAQ